MIDQFTQVRPEYLGTPSRKILYSNSPLSSPHKELDDPTDKTYNPQDELISSDDEVENEDVER